VKAASHWLDERGNPIVWDGLRTALSRAVDPGETVELKPGSYRLLMLGLKEPFQLGQKVKGTLVFEKAGLLETYKPQSVLGCPSADAGHDTTSPAQASQEFPQLLRNLRHVRAWDDGG
jgi:hypothetical protein